MANKKILTVEEQKHLLSTLPELFQNLTQAEIQDIIVKLGLQDLLDQDGNLINVYTVDIYSNKPTYIISDYDIKIRGNAYNKGVLANDEVTSWRWERISGVSAEDAAWAKGKNTQELTLSESDFTSRVHSRDIIFKVYATIKNTEYSDEITYSKSQIFNKIQIKASHDLFLESFPSSITVTTVEEGIFSDYKWYLGNTLVATTKSFNLSVNFIPLKSSAVLKVEAKDSTGKIHSDTKTIPRISNGSNGEPGVPGTPGSNSYTWIKYSDSPDGTNMSEYPVDSITGLSRNYIGIASNKSTPIESNNPSDYTWSKYIGTDGVPGESVLSSIIFKRSANAPATPTGGTYLNPIPPGWSDGIPDIKEDFPVWMSSRVFTLSGNNPQDPTWSEPQITSDTATLDFDWSSSDVVNPGTPDAPLNGAIWEETSSINSIWMAIQRTVNGEKKPWEVKKVKGEEGVSSYMWIKYSEYPLGRDTNGTISMFDTPFIMENGVREDMVYMGIAYNKQNKTEADPNTPEGAPEVYTWSKIKGENGHSNYILELSNDNTSVPALADGTISNPAVAFSTATTNISLTYGNDLVDRGEYTLQFNASSGVTFVTSNQGHTLSITGLTADVGQIEVKAVSTGTTPKIIATATFSIVKIKGSAIYEIFPSVNAIKVTNTPGQNPTLSPTAIEVNVKMNTGESVSNVTSGKLTYKYIYANTNYNSTDDGTQITIGELMQINNSGDPLFIEFKYFHPVTNTLVDIERVSFNRDGVSGTSVEQRYKSNTNPTTPPALDVSETNPTGWSLNMPVLTTGEILWMTKATKKGDTGALVGTWSNPVRISGATGPQGPQGINGTSGPTPRLLEFVQGQTYKNGGLYIDYAYYRSNDINEGWYTVKLPTGHTPGTEVSQIYTGGIPDSTKFNKAPFTKEMSFGTVLAEQANLAGFIFRNRVLNSQDVSYQSCTTTNDRGPFPNLSLDGEKGIIKFLEKMFLSKDGIIIKDDCGRNRMVFMFENGVPVLKFFNETGGVVWEAGQNNFGGVTTAFFSPQVGIKTSIPVVDTPPTSTTPISELLPYITTINNQYKINENNPITNIYGQKYVKMNPEVPTIPEHNKIFKSSSISSGVVEDGWYVYLISNGSRVNTQGFREGVVVHFVKIVGGVIIQYESRNYLIAPTIVYRTYSTDLYGGSGDTLYVTWVDKDGNSQAYSNYTTGPSTWMSFSVCAEEGTFNSNGSIIEGDIC